MKRVGFNLGSRPGLLLVWTAIVATTAFAAEPSYTFAHLAGPTGGAGSADGIGAAARFAYPHGIVADGAGNLYVADTGNSVIRKIAPNGLVTTVAGAVAKSGSADGLGNVARFDRPTRVTIDAAGNLYVADAGNHTIRKISPAGMVTTVAGLAGQPGSADGMASFARFYKPTGIAMDGAGNLFVADLGNQLVRKIDGAGIVTTLAGLAGQTGSVDGSGSDARFNQPEDVAVDRAGNIYVGDSYNHTIRKIASDGGVVTFAGRAGVGGALQDGTGAAARFQYPEGVAVDGAGNVYVADVGNNRICKISPEGSVKTIAAGHGIGDGTLTTIRPASVGFGFPTGVTVDQTGNIFVADEQNHTIRKIALNGNFEFVVTTVAGTAIPSGYQDGVGTNALFYEPFSVTVDKTGNAYVTDLLYNVIRKITSDGTTTTLAGGRFSGTADGTGTKALFMLPTGTGADELGNVYVADNAALRKITPTGVVTTWAGNPTEPGDIDGGGSVARLAPLGSMAVDHSGNVYLTQGTTVRKVTPGGIVTTLAGVAGETGATDGNGTAARFGGLHGLARDAAGNLYVADMGNETIRKITPAGSVSTLAGRAGVSGSADGTGSDARFAEPIAVTVDANGYVFVADYTTSIIRRISPGGEVTTIGGVAGYPANTDGVGALARFNCPTGIAVDAEGALYVAEMLNSDVRKGTIGKATPLLEWHGVDPMPYGTALSETQLNATANIPGVFTYAPGLGTVFPTGPQTVVATFTPSDTTHYNIATLNLSLLVMATKPVIAESPRSQSGAPGATLTLSTAATGSSNMSYRWWKNNALTGAEGPSLTLDNLQSSDAGLYVAEAVDEHGGTLSEPAIVGILTADKVIGAGMVVDTGIRHPNGNFYDQLLVTGAGETLTAEPGKVTRTSFVDLDGDIVQVEFAGAGSLSLALAYPSGPAVPVKYNQPSVTYMMGQAQIVIVGADETTNVSVFTVGRATAFDPTGAYDILRPVSETNDPANNGSPLFEGHGGTGYDGMANIGFIAIASANGKFGGVRTSDAVYSGFGITGIYAPGVEFTGPVFIGNLSAAGNVEAVILLGSADGETRITGGDLFQSNGAPVQVSGLTQLKFTAGQDSHGRDLAAMANRAILQQNGQDVTAQIVVNPP